MNSLEKEEYIDVMEIVRGLWIYKFLLIALAVIMALMFSVRVVFFTKDRYVASGILYVSNRGAQGSSDELSLNDIDTAKSMTETCREILAMRTFLSGVSEDIGNKYNWKQLGSMTSVSALNDTELLVISATAGTAEDAYLVAESMVRNAPYTLKSVFKNGSVEIIDEVVIPDGPVGKGTMKEALKGALVGLFIGIAFVVVRNLFDTKVHKSEDVATRYNVSILGEIAQ